MKNFKKLLPAVFVLLLIAGIVFTYKNDLLKYSDFDNSIKVELTGSDNYEDVFTALRDTQNLVEIDRYNNIIYYQHTGIGEVQTEVTQKLAEFEGVSAGYSQVFPSANKVETLIKTLISYVLIAVIFLGATFVLKTRFYKWSLKTYLAWYAAHLLIFASAAALLTGLISVLSLIYKVSYLDLFSYYFVAFILSLLIWENLTEGVSRLNAQFIKLVQITSIIVLLLAFGLGAKVVIPVVIMFTSLIAIYLPYYSILWFAAKVGSVNIAIKLPKISMPNRKSKDQSPKSSEKQVEAKKVKKAKKTKTKSKHKKR